MPSTTQRRALQGAIHAYTLPMVAGLLPGALVSTFPFHALLLTLAFYLHCQSYLCLPFKGRQIYFYLHMACGYTGGSMALYGIWVAYCGKDLTHFHTVHGIVGGFLGCCLVFLLSLGGLLLLLRTGILPKGWKKVIRKAHKMAGEWTLVGYSIALCLGMQYKTGQEIGPLLLRTLLTALPFFITTSLLQQR